jgi:uncharacterized protein (DUF362 family)
MSNSRRGFLKQTAGLGLTFLGAPRLFAADPAPSAVAEAAKPAEMAIARWSNAAATEATPGELIRKLTEAAIENLGGMKRFVKRGDVVWVKPNIGWNRGPELAANTHPDVVAALVRMCFDAGAAKVKVGDNTCNESRDCYENSGIAPAAKALGAEIVFLDRTRFREMDLGGRLLKKHPVYPGIIESDLVINVPVCKHHSATRVSLCMKNYMGVVESRQTFHQDLPTTISDITQFMKPRLCVLDATRLLTDHGPTGGDPKDVRAKHTVAAGVDIVAMDAFGAELLGHKPADIETVAKGAEYGLGRIDYRSLALRELSVA